MGKDLKEALAEAFPLEFRRAVLQAVQQGGVRAGVERFGVPVQLIRYWQGEEALAEAEEATMQGEWPGSLAGPTGEGAGCAWGRPQAQPAEATRGAEAGATRGAAGVPSANAPTAGGTGVRVRRRSGRRHTAAERAAAVADWREMGTASAAQKHGISEETLRKWRIAARAASAAGAAPGSVPGTTMAVAELPAAPGSVPATPTAVAEPPAPREGVPPPKSAGQEDVAGAMTHGRGHRYSPSEKAEAVRQALLDGVGAAVRQTGASRFAVYQWLAHAAKEAGEEGEAREPTEVERQRDLEILHEWHKQPGLGPSQIRNQLHRRGIRTSVHTVRRVMEENGYRPPKVKSEAHHERYEAVRPNALWHLDHLHRHIHKAATFTLVLLDDYSRYVVGHGVDDAERADTVTAAFEQAVARHGKPEAVMTDRGSAFWAWQGISRLTALLTELGVDHYVAEDKENNGKIEKFNADLSKEFFDVREYADVGEMRRALATHFRWYNHSRTHHSLGGVLVPADRYYGRVEEVMETIESGGTPDLHTLFVAQRVLDLFKVTSSGGKPEVWLLGQRIL